MLQASCTYAGVEKLLSRVAALVLREAAMPGQQGLCTKGNETCVWGDPGETARLSWVGRQQGMWKGSRDRGLGSVCEGQEGGCLDPFCHSSCLGQ